jgi:uncharacterized protein YceH (UPF0502 family)
MELAAAEGRVLGCLIEKAATAPEAYPVTLDDLRLSCNQTEERQPIVAYGDRTVEDTLMALKSKGLARFVPPAPEEGVRAVRYSHRADQRWRLGPAHLAVLAVLLLGGPQTLAAVHTRACRLFPFAGTADVEAVLDTLAARIPQPFAARLDSPSGGPRSRWAQVLADEPEGDVAIPQDALPFGEVPGGGRRGARGRAGPGPRDGGQAPTYGELAARVAELERRLAAATGPASAATVPRDGWAGGVSASPADDLDVEAIMGLADRLAAVERRVATVEAELNALRRGAER